jgi:hypothetical protein
VYVLQQLDSIVLAAVERVKLVDVSTLEVVDGGDAESLSAVAGAFPHMVARVLQESSAMLGVDVVGLINPKEGR